MIFGDGSIFHLEDVLEDPKKIQPRESIPLKIKRIYCVDTATLDDGSLLVLIICSDTTVSLQWSPAFMQVGFHQCRTIGIKFHLLNYMLLKMHLPDFGQEIVPKVTRAKRQQSWEFLFSPLAKNSMPLL